jgi:hypothetical protein
MTEKDDLEDSVLDGRILLNGPTGSEMWGWTGSSWLRVGTSDVHM